MMSPEGKCGCHPGGIANESPRDAKDIGNNGSLIHGVFVKAGCFKNSRLIQWNNKCSFIQDFQHRRVFAPFRSSDSFLAIACGNADSAKSIMGNLDLDRVE